MSRPTQDTTKKLYSYVYGIITLYDATFQKLLLQIQLLQRGPTTPTLPEQWWFGLFPFRSPLLRESLIVFFSSGYLDVSVHQVGLHKWITVLQTAELSHSEIFGSKVICTFPKLIAAYRVLHRLREPRHPPCALNYFLWSLLIYLNLIVFFLFTIHQRTFFLKWKWWRISESNRWPPACKAGALASWANPPIVVSTSNT